MTRSQPKSNNCPPNSRLKITSVRRNIHHFDGTLEVPGGDEIKDPVIFAASTANMKYFEAESLIATGISDAYIRLTEEACNKYAKDLPKELKDKKVTFLGLSSMTN